MSKTQIKLGDMVTGSYHGVAFEAVVSGHCGGYVDLDLTAPITVRGSVRTALSISCDSDERDSLRVVARPAAVPALRVLSDGAVRLA